MWKCEKCSKNITTSNAKCMVAFACKHVRKPEVFVHLFSLFIDNFWVHDVCLPPFHHVVPLL